MNSLTPFSIFKLLVLLHLLFFSFKSFALTIQHVSHSPTYIPIPNSESEVVIRFYLDEDATVRLKIYDDRNYLIREINSVAALSKGDNSLLWNLRDYSGKPAPKEAYHYTLEAASKDKTVLYDITDLSTSNKSTLFSPKWDKEKGEVSYKLSKASRVNIRIGVDDGGPLLATLYNWLPRERGMHVEKWDGYDAEHQFKISQLTKAQLYIQSYALTPNTILVGKNIQNFNYIDLPNVKETRSRALSKSNMFDSTRKLAQDRRDYQLLIELPDTDSSKKGIPIYSGTINVKINAPKKDIERLLRDRFEPILFIDGELEAELESGFFPITWKLDTTKFKQGNHFITVNVRGYDGQYGTVTKNIYIEDQRE